jgi:hypothetical protein
LVNISPQSLGYHATANGLIKYINLAGLEVTAAQARSPVGECVAKSIRVRVISNNIDDVGVYTVYKNNVATALVLSIDAADGVGNYSTDVDVSFAAGDDVYVKADLSTCLAGVLAVEITIDFLSES